MNDLNWGQSLVQRLIQFLPLDPFAQYVDVLANLPYLGYLNWFFPVSEILGVLIAWLGAVSLFYVYSIAMRWAKVIGGG